MGVRKEVLIYSGGAATYWWFASAVPGKYTRHAEAQLNDGRLSNNITSYSGGARQLNMNRESMIRLCR